jgi:hypothetical protein
MNGRVDWLQITRALTQFVVPVLIAAAFIVEITGVAGVRHGAAEHVPRGFLGDTELSHYHESSGSPLSAGCRVALVT